jgi:WD40 repeat protein
MTFKLWDALTGKMVKSYDLPYRVFAAVFSPDGKLILSDSMEVKLWDKATAKEIKTIKSVN